MEQCRRVSMNLLMVLNVVTDKMLKLRIFTGKTGRITGYTSVVYSAGPLEEMSVIKNGINFIRDLAILGGFTTLSFSCW
jgi:hypothetical protein